MAVLCWRRGGGYALCGATHTLQATHTRAATHTAKQAAKAKSSEGGHRTVRIPQLSVHVFRQEAAQAGVGVDGERGDEASPKNLFEDLRNYFSAHKSVTSRLITSSRSGGSVGEAALPIHCTPHTMASTSKAGVRTSSHPLIVHKITQMRKATNSPKYLHQLIKEVSTFLCYEATADMSMEKCEVKTRTGAEEGERIGDRVGIIPVLRGGLGMVEAMTEMVSNAQVWHLGIYRDKTSLLPIEYYNKLPKKVTVHTVYVLDPMPISGATAVAAMDILKAWGEGLKTSGKTLSIKFICIVASEVKRDAHGGRGRGAGEAAKLLHRTSAARHPDPPNICCSPP